MTDQPPLELKPDERELAFITDIEDGIKITLKRLQDINSQAQDLQKKQQELQVELIGYTKAGEVLVHQIVKSHGIRLNGYKYKWDHDKKLITRENVSVLPPVNEVNNDNSKGGAVVATTN